MLWPIAVCLLGRATWERGYTNIPNAEDFSRERLERKFRDNQPPRELIDQTPVDYVRAFLESDNRPSARALVEYIESLY